MWGSEAVLLGLEQVGDLNCGVQRTCDAGTEAPPAVQPVHAGHRVRVASHAQHLAQLTTLIHLQAGGTESEEKEAVRSTHLTWYMTAWSGAQVRTNLSSSSKAKRFPCGMLG